MTACFLIVIGFDIIIEFERGAWLDFAIDKNPLDPPRRWLAFTLALCIEASLNSGEF